MVLECRHRTREQDGPVKAVIVSDMPVWQLCIESVSAVLQTGKSKLCCGGGCETRLWKGGRTEFDIAAFKQNFWFFFGFGFFFFSYWCYICK